MVNRREESSREGFESRPRRNAARGLVVAGGARRADSGAACAEQWRRATAGCRVRLRSWVGGGLLGRRESELRRKSSGGAQRAAAITASACSGWSSLVDFARELRRRNRVRREGLGELVVWCGTATERAGGARDGGGAARGWRTLEVSWGRGGGLR